MTKEYNLDDHFKIITVGFEKPAKTSTICPNHGGTFYSTPFCNICGGEPETYTITRLESWSDETWAEVIDAVEDTTASFGEEE